MGLGRVGSVGFTSQSDVHNPLLVWVATRFAASSVDLLGKCCGRSLELRL